MSGVDKKMSLHWLRSQRMLTNNNVNFILEEDVKNDELLLLKSGKALDQTSIDKLLNFGVSEVCVNCCPNDMTVEEFRAQEELKKNFVKEQNVLILQKEFKEISSLVKQLITLGFSEKKLFATVNQKLLERYFASQKPAYLFIENEFFTDNIKELINANYNSSKLNVFIIAEKHAVFGGSIKNSQFISDNVSSRLLIKPLNEAILRQIVKETVEFDYQMLLANKEQSTENNVKTA